MPFITFTATPKLPRDMAHLAYKQGDVVELPSDSCERWIRRGVAEYTKKPAPATPAAAVPSEPIRPLPHHAEPVLSLDTAAPFDPQTASVDELRDFLAQHGRAPRANTGEARLRELAADIVAAQ